jgi:amidophosphoribosyltransferase
MSGFFGVVAKEDCVSDLFFGTDYHSHLGTVRGGMAVNHNGEFKRYIHDITNSQFRSKFQDDVGKMRGNKGIGIISDFEDQPLTIYSHLGKYAIVTISAITNTDEIVQQEFKNRSAHFSELNQGVVNPTELVAALINQEDSFEKGIQRAQQIIKGSCSLLILTEKGMYVARDRFGRTPVIIGEKPNAWAATMETCAFPNLGYVTKKFLGPGEVVFIDEDGMDQRIPPGEIMHICAFLWVYYGYPSCNYEDINVEEVRYRCGEFLAKRDDVEVDIVAGIPDSGIAHAIGYANFKGLPFKRPFVKYTPTWPRSFMPQDQKFRDLVAKMKLIPIKELIDGKRILFCEDSIVRGTQLKDTIQRLYDYGAVEVHMRPACPPLIFGCKFLNFSRSRSVLDLAGRRAIKEIEGADNQQPQIYADINSEQYKLMVSRICERLHLTSLRYQLLEDLVAAIGLPKEKLCTYCFDGCGE